MVSQVPIVGILMAVNGGLICIMGGVLAGVGGMFKFILKNDPNFGNRPQDDTFATVMMVVYGIMGATLLACGITNVIAGLRVYRFRSRIFAITALILSVASVFSCYCSITTIGMLVYGLIVLLDGDVKRAFEWGAEGMTSSDIQYRHLSEKREERRRWDDDDEDRLPLRAELPSEPPDDRIKPSE